MLAASAKKLVHLLLVLFLVTIATFLMLELVPGDPATAILGTTGRPEQYEAIREELRLDRPVTERYLEWIGDVLTGDLGQTLVPPVRDVSDLIASRLPVTIEIAVLAMVIALAVSMPVGIWSAYRQEMPFDRVASGVTFAIVAVPSFLAGLLLIFLFIFHADLTRNITVVAAAAAAAWLLITSAARFTSRSALSPWAPAIGALVFAVVAAAAAAAWPDFPRQGFVRLTDERGLSENLRSAFLPAVTLALTEIAVFSQLLRGDMITTLQEDFILFARAKGMPTWHILVREALRPSSFSLITIAGVSIGRLLGGAVIVEAIFGLPGMGTLIIDGIHSKDYRIVQAGVLVVAVFYVIVNAVVDLAYTYLDPRTRRG